jgi:hypothetical protein
MLQPPHSLQILLLLHCEFKNKFTGDWSMTEPETKYYSWEARQKCTTCLCIAWAHLQHSALISWLIQQLLET